MATITLNDQEKTKVLRDRFLHPSPQVQKRMEALYLCHLGKSYQEAAEILDSSVASIGRWLKRYREKGLDGLRTLDYGRPQNELTKHQSTLEGYFRVHPPSSIREACVEIKRLTGIDRSECPVREFLRSIGMSFRKTGRVPGKADREAQETFKKKSWSPG